MAIIKVGTMTLAGCNCDGHERMRGRAAALRETLGLLSPAEVLMRWAATDNDAVIDDLRRGVHGRRLRDQLTMKAE